MTVFNFRLYLSICCSPSSTGGSGDKCSLVCESKSESEEVNCKLENKNHKMVKKQRKDAKTEQLRLPPPPPPPKI